MKLPSLSCTSKIAASLSSFYLKNEASIWTVTSIGCNIASTTLAFKNARAIEYYISTAKEMLANAQTDEERKQIYMQCGKALLPLVGSIVAFQTMSIFATYKLKSYSDKKIAELTSALSVANNAITAYQAFQKEAESKLSPEDVKELHETVATKAIKDNPPTDENTTSLAQPSSTTPVYKYYDQANNRYFDSTISPTEFRERIHNLSMKFTKHEINQYDDYGNCKITRNDIWKLIDPRLINDPGYMYGWTDERLRGDDIIEDAIDVDIDAGEDPYNPDHTVWYIRMGGGPLFRTRL